MPDSLVDLLLPATDRGVLIQWVVMAIVWSVALAWSLRWRQEYRTFTLGLVVANLAWFAARAIH